MKHVVHVSPTYFGEDSIIAGGERYTHELCRAMARRTRTTLVTFGPRSFVRKEGELTIRCHKKWTRPNGGVGNPVAPGFLKDLLHADVIHCHQYRIVATDMTIMAMRPLGKQIFVTDLGGSGFSLSRWLPLWRGVERFLMISRYNCSLWPTVPDKKKTVIFGGADTARFSHDGKARENRILFVGRLLHHKGIELLFQALDPDMELLVVGKAYDPQYAAKLREAAAGRKVTFRDDLDDNALLEQYRRCAVVAIPSLIDGGYTTALEAMACETPVVATDVGSMGELLRDGEGGYLTPPGEPDALRERLRAVLGDPGLARKLGEAGRHRVEAEFTWDRVVDRCFAEYGFANPP